jgi:hypothetical protein
MNNDRRKAQK